MNELISVRCNTGDRFQSGRDKLHNITQDYGVCLYRQASPADAKLIRDTVHIMPVAMGCRTHSAPIAVSSITLIAVYLQCKYSLIYLYSYFHKSMSIYEQCIIYLRVDSNV